MRICIAVDNGNGVGTEAIDGSAQAWCQQHGFEHLRCSLRAEELETITSCWQNPCCRSLLSQPNGDEDGPDRIVEALACHSWKPLDEQSRVNSGTVKVDADTSENAKSKQEARAVEVMEAMSDDIAQVCKIEDHVERRERAAKVVMDLARELNLDEDSEDEPF